MSDDIDDYVVELAVTGTWRESIVAESREEAERVAKQNLREQLPLDDGEWGDIGWRAVSPTLPGEELMVHTRIAGENGTAFHTSEACAPSVMLRTECTLREAVEANRKPCGNCCGDDVLEAYSDVYDDVTGEP